MLVERMISLGFEDVVAPASDLAARLDEVGATAVSLTVGRVDWLAYPWAAHPDAWSPWVRDTGRDFVAESLAALGGDRRVTLVLDVMAEGWIARPGVAGVDAWGIPSTEFASLTALTAGPVGARLLELVADVVARYSPAAVTLTELFLRDYTFGDDDLASWRAWSGHDDWPRSGSTIDETDPQLAAWRADAVTAFVARVARAAGVPVEIEVRARWDAEPDPGRDGQDYAALVAVPARLVIWGYFPLHGRDAASLERLAREAPAGSTISVGLWAPGGVVSPGELRAAVAAATRGGADAIAVVPASLLSAGHWEALRPVR